MEHASDQAGALAALNAAQFAGRVDEVPFELVNGDIRLTVTLAQCRENPLAAGPDSTRVPFSLLFRADDLPEHPFQQVQSLLVTLNDASDTLADGIMLTRVLRPVGMGPGVYFQAVFN
ncbi:hypothetical protein MBH78_14185 [Oceanimonas sp. NS1]|nr:hypothetical protein [Oceanimonas sp. NS1]